MKLFSSSFKFLGIQDELKARPPYRVDDDNYPGDHGNENVADYVTRVDDKYDDNSKDDADHDVDDDDNVAHEVPAELKAWFLYQVGLPVAPEDLQEHRGLWGKRSG